MVILIIVFILNDVLIVLWISQEAIINLDEKEKSTKDPGDKAI